jgi:acrylyl-CoA reductase (NADPH)
LSTSKPTGVVTSIGLAADVALHTTVMPFVLRGVSLIGIDSAHAGFSVRERAWARLAADLRPRHLLANTRVVAFDELPQVFESFVAGQANGRTVVEIATAEGTS